MSFFKESGGDVRGSILLYVVLFGSLAFSLVVVTVSGYSFGEYRAAVHRFNRESALQVAEAGINYYRWHLSHSPDDYEDGTNAPGPYIHAYKDADGDVIGRYSLNIIPPSATSSIVTIESTGWLDSQTSSRRTIRVKLASGSSVVTNYAYISNTDVWISNETKVYGPMHSNSGIRFDGEAEAPITSAVATYMCQPMHGNGCQNEEKPGIWGQGGPESYWDFPVSSQDFTGAVASLATLKTDAQSGGLYFSSSGKQGWHLTFNENGTISARKVSATKCYKGDDLNGPENSWFCVDIKTQDSATVYSMPANGRLYVDDTVWIDGKVKGKVTLGVGSGKSAILNGKIEYKDRGKNDDEDECEEDMLAVMAEQDIIIPHDLPGGSDDLEVSGAFFAINGSVKRYYYSGGHLDDFKVFGAIISNGMITVSWISNGGAVVSGFDNPQYTYDSCLLYNPPVAFPKAVNYTLVSWEEVKN